MTSKPKKRGKHKHAQRALARRGERERATTRHVMTPHWFLDPLSPQKEERADRPVATVEGVYYYLHSTSPPLSPFTSLSPMAPSSMPTSQEKPASETTPSSDPKAPKPKDNTNETTVATATAKKNNGKKEGNDEDSTASSLSSTPLISLKKNTVKKAPTTTTTSNTKPATINKKKTKATKKVASTKKNSKAIAATKKASSEKKKKSPATAAPKKQKKSISSDGDAKKKPLKKPKTTPETTTKTNKKASLKAKSPATTTTTTTTTKSEASQKPTKVDNLVFATATTSAAAAAITHPHMKAVKDIIYNDNDDDDDDDYDEDDEPEAACCCLCFCGVDCSDRALFFPKDRQQEINELTEDDDPYYFSMKDPFLDERLYDKNNALVYCDSCNRLYHQKCHFVPLLVLPRGDWNCLVCTSTDTAGTFTNSATTLALTPPSASSSAAKQKKKKGKKAPPPPRGPPLKHFVLEDASKALLFSTPPTVSAKELERLWEVQTGAWKAQLWFQQLKQLKTFLNSQASNIRMATAALETIASTKKNRQHFTKSQELKQTLLRMTSSKWKIREALLSLESIRVQANTTLLMRGTSYDQDNDDANDDGDKNNTKTRTSLLEDWCRQYPQHAHHIFPYGQEMHKTKSRIIPRTREMMLAEATTTDKNATKKPEAAVVPSEIMVLSPNSKKRVKTLPNTTCSTSNAVAAAPPSVPILATSETSGRAKDNNSSHHKKKQSDDDNDSGITLDDLQCCVCMIGDASDENDVLLCDGQGCYRAFHMKCIYPEVTPEDIANEEEDWFCPLCSTIGHCVVQTQVACCGEAEERHDDDSSVKSWVEVGDVFPTSQWEFETAERYKRGRQSEEIQELLATYLGEEFAPTTPAMPVGSDSEDEEDYSLFDEESFNARRQREKAELEAKRGADDDDDDSSSDGDSSAASLVDMSSVELEIGKDELAALTDEEMSDGNDDDEDNNNDGDGSESSGSPRKRISRRLRSKSRASSTHQSEQSSLLDSNGADFNEANILEGKRRRKPIDYRKLNDALFGALSAKERAEIDDTVDFKLKKKRKASPSSAEKKRKEQGRKRLKMSQQKNDENEEEQEEENDSDDNKNGSDDDNSSAANSDDHDSVDDDSDVSDRNSSDDEGGEEEDGDGDDDGDGGKGEKDASDKINAKEEEQKKKRRKSDGETKESQQAP